MTKSELKTGMIVTRRDGQKLTVYRNCSSSFEHDYHNDVIVNAENATWHSLDSYTEDLKNALGYPEFDIMMVECAHHPYDFNKFSNNAKVVKTLWTREDPKKKMTVAEIEAILGYKVEIVSDK